MPPESIQHEWTHMLEAKRKELTRLNNAYKNTLSNAKVRWQLCWSELSVASYRPSK